MRAVAEVATAASGRNIDLLDSVDYRLAETPEDREEIYRLRYRAYLREGAVLPSVDQRVTDRFDDLPNSWIFGVYLDGVLASSIRLTVATPEQPACPSMDVFPDLLKPELMAGKTIIDPTRFVADPSREKRFPELPYVTLRLAYISCGFFNADMGLASVRAEHQAFYRRVFMYKPWSSPREYPGLLKPICLMSVDYPAMRDKVFERYPYLRSSYFERRMLFRRSAQAGSSAAATANPCERGPMPQGSMAQASVAQGSAAQG
jgi:N-acyl-L-homoserine lactone synthetase